MSHLICPLCGKSSPLSSFPPEKLDMDLKLVTFKGLGRGRGFAKSEEYSILGDEVYTPIVADRVNELYSTLVKLGFIVRTVDSLTLPLLDENDKLKQQMRSLNSDNSSLANENNELKIKIEKAELRSHVDYLLLECLSIDKSAKLIHGDGGYQLKLSPEPTKLNLFLLLLVKEVPDQLRKELLTHINSDNYPLLEFILEKVSKEVSPIKELLGDGHSTFKGLSYSGRDPYLMELADVKEIVRRVKGKCRLIYADSDEFDSWVVNIFNLGERIQGESPQEFISRLNKELKDTPSKRLIRDLI